MENESKPVLPENEEENFLEPYYHKPVFTGTFWRWLVMILVFIAAAVFFKKSVLDASMDAQELKSSIQIFGISSQWVVKEKIQTGDQQGIIVVPEITVRLRNTGERTLQYVSCIAVFRFADNGKLIGEGYQMTMKQPLPVGGETGPVLLRSPLGFRANSLASFSENPKEFREAFVEIFARSKNSKTVSLKQVFVSRKIDGVDIEVKVK